MHLKINQIQRVLVVSISIMMMFISAFAVDRMPKRKFVEGRVIIKFKESSARGAGRMAESKHAKTFRKLMKGKTKKRFRSRAQLWNIEGDVNQIITQYKNDPRIEYIEPDYIISIADVFPSDPEFIEQWSLHNTGQTGGQIDADIDMPEAWEFWYGEPTIVAVIDSGVDYNHEDLENNMWVNSNEVPGNGIDDDGNGYIDDVFGYDFINNDGDPMDDNGHGTHVAGIIGAEHDNGVGISGIQPYAQIMALKFLDQDGYGYASGAISAIEYSIAMGAKISNNSYGFSFISQAMQDAVAQSNASDQLFVTAAGNGYGSNRDINPNYPASFEFENIISVASTDRFDGLSDFSDIGPISIDLAAPGSNIYSSLPPFAYLSGTCNDNDGNGYDYCSGTSMASPHVAGAAALVWSRRPELSSQYVKELILSTTDQLPSLHEKILTEGRLNAFRAVSADETQIPRIDVSPDSIDLDLVSGTINNFSIKINNTGNTQLNWGISQKRDSVFKSWTSNEISYDWYDISSIGTETGINWVNRTHRVTLPFGFPFYDDIKTELTIHLRGLLIFVDDISDYYYNHSIPNQIAPNDHIAPFWTSLVNDYSSGIGKIYYFYDAPNDRFIVQYHNMKLHGYENWESNISFQAILHPNGDIVFQYKEVKPSQNRSVIGIENADGTDGIQIAYRNLVIDSPLAILIKNIVPETSFDTISGSINPNDSTLVNLQIDTTGIESGLHTATITVKHNCYQQPDLTIPINIQVTEAEDDIIIQDEVISESRRYLATNSISIQPVTLIHPLPGEVVKFEIVSSQ